MKLIFIGSGSAFTVGGNYQSNMVLQTSSGRKMLIDCGGDARHGLYEAGISYAEIEGVYISHLHNDHIGGLEWLALGTMYELKQPKKILLRASPEILDRLWNLSLRGGLGSLSEGQASLETYFTLAPIPEDNTFSWEDVHFSLIKTIHTIEENIVVPSYGLFLKHRGNNILITTDTQFTPDLFDPYYKQADLIFHDCETSPNKSGVHAHYTELVTLPPEIKSKMWLYHYNPGPLPDAVQDGFKGFVRKGQSFDI